MARTHVEQFMSLSYDRDNGWSGAFPHWNQANTLVLVFGASSYATDTRPLRELADAFSHAKVIGCSTAGEVHATTVRDESLSVVVCRFEHTRLTLAVAPVRDQRDSHRAGETIAMQLEGLSPKGVLVYSDGLNVNGSEMVRGLNNRLSAATITGGLAGDGPNFKRTWVLRDGEPVGNIVVAVGLSGERVRVGCGSHGGWDVFGHERIVTKSEGNVLFELDGKPALDLYRDYLGEHAEMLPGSALLFPLAVKGKEADARTVVRTVLAVDDTARSMTFAGDIPMGASAQLMRANLDRLIEGAGVSGRRSFQTMGSSRPCVQIAVSCVGRRLLMGTRTEEELESAMESLPTGSIQTGFYSYGEIAPTGVSSCMTSDLHNQTMTATTITEV